MKPAKSLSPKAQAWLYVIVGVVAIGAALYFMSVEASVFDWFILGMGVVGVIQGVREFWALRNGTE
ncbi:MAG TPA: hypothetical protein PKV13_09635 [Propionicimonas sp.]|nr:hypothetical protein [Propionicimonas sp.]HRA06866.1 hypothetical protein [Propionicimonas sp.]